jgi:hypothetical protein
VDDKLRKLQRQAQISGSLETVWHYAYLLEKLIGERDIKLKLWLVKFTHYDRSDLSWNDGMYLSKTLAAKSACDDILELMADWVDCDESQALHDARVALYEAGEYEKLMDEYHGLSQDTFELVEMDVS